MKRFIISGDNVRREALDYIADLPVSPLMEVTVKRYRKSKTQEQLAYLFGVVLPAICEHIEYSTGEHYTTEQVYEWMANEYAPRDVVKINNKVNVIMRTASRMKVDEMSAFIESIIRHAAMHMDLVIPEAQ